MKVKQLGWSVVLLFILCGTLTAKITVDWDKEANFTGFKTYAWEKGTPAKNPLMDQRVIDAVDEQMKAKGLQKVEADKDPDLLVIYHAAVGTQTELNTMNMGGWGWRWGGGTATTTVDKIPVGQLVVDIGDAKTKKLLWMGNASDTLSDDPDKNTKKLNSAVQKMFQKFPPPVKK
jgi:hypothetical protein